MDISTQSDEHAKGVIAPARRPFADLITMLILLHGRQKRKSHMRAV